MKIVIAGAGRMAEGLLHDILTYGDPEEILLVDIDPQRLEHVREACRRRFPQAPLRIEVCDLEDLGAFAPLVEGCKGLISAASYRLNEGLTRLAIERRFHMVDLGGNPEVVAKQLALDGAARKAGVTVIPDCGLAPGMVSLLAADGIRRVRQPERVRIRVGGLPVDPQPPLQFGLAFSAEGLINEYLEDAVVLRGGKITRVPSLTEVETLTFPPPYGELEAFQTAGGTSTLPATYEGQLQELDYKTIRYPGHCEIIRTLFALGLASTEPLRTRAGAAIPKEALIALLERHLPRDFEDVILVRVTTDGRERITHELIATGDEEAGLTAMQRGTAFPASIILQMLLRGEAQEVGVVPQERALDPGPFLAALARRGLHVQVREGD